MEADARAGLPPGRPHPRRAPVRASRRRWGRPLPAPAGARPGAGGSGAPSVAASRGRPVPRRRAAQEDEPAAAEVGSSVAARRGPQFSCKRASKGVRREALSRKCVCVCGGLACEGILFF